MARRFAARGSPLRQTGILIAMLGFAALCLWGTGILTPPAPAPRPQGVWISWICLLFAGLAAVAAFRSLFDVREQVVVDERGIFMRRWSETPIPWHEIIKVEMRRTKMNRFFCLWLSHPEAYRPSRYKPWLAKANSAMGFGDVQITMMGLDRSVADLSEAVREYRPDLVG